MTIRHGVAVEYVDTVPRPVSVVPSNVIALVGTAPTFLLDPADVHKDDPVLSISDAEDIKLGGPKTPGYTIPYALDAFRDNGAGYVEIINVFDIDTHQETATDIDYEFPADGLQLLQTVGNVIQADSPAIGLVGAVTVAGRTEGTDYSVDAQTGELSLVAGSNITPGETVTVTYTFADPSKVTPEEIIGTAESANDRTGAQAIRDIFVLRGYQAKLIVCPIFNEHGGVAGELEAIAETIDAYFFLDAPAGATRDQVVAGRGGAAPVGTFATASRRAILCYPRIYSTDGTLQPLSQYAAGVTARVDAEEGHWISPSNHIIRGIDNSQGLELRLSADFTSFDTDVNALNRAGIVTVFNSFATGYRLWGNRSALFPSDTSPLNFIPVGRAFDVFMESLQRSALPYVDKLANVATAETVLDAGNAFIREEIQRGAMVPGSTIEFSADNNTESSIAKGILVFYVVLMFYTPAETIVFRGTIDISLLSSVLPSDEA